MRCRMLAMDLDGTLTNSRKEISDKNKEYVHRAAEAGVHIVLASGRPEIGQRSIIERLELKRIGGFMLACNGSHIVEFRNGREKSLRSTTLDPDTITQASSFARDRGVDAFSYNSVGILTENPEGEWLQKEVYNCGRPLIYTDCLEESLIKAKIETHKLVITASHEDLLKIKGDLEKLLGDHAWVFFSEPHFLEVTPPGIDKATSLTWLCGHLGIRPEEVIACGDSGNDISMLKFAGVGVAVGNALPEVKAVADCVVASNDEDGVAEAVEQHILHKEI